MKRVSSPRFWINPRTLKRFPRNYLHHCICACLSVSGVTYAGPEGGEVVGGAGSISRSGSTTTIHQDTDRMAIDWRSYDVGADERVQYVQPDTSSVSLNRILSNTGSQIHGRIDANGHVILMNPHGILFGENSVVNAGGILASGLNIDTSDFMNGDFTFNAIEGTEGFVLNSGTLNAAIGGSVALLGQQVTNDGVISAQLGSVAFTAGREAVVRFDSDGLVGVRVSQSLLEDDIGVDAAVINTGEITAEDGQILLTASASRDVFSQAVNAGALDTTVSVVMDSDGSFTLGGGADVVNTGSLSVSGDTGGDVVVLGENITHSGVIHADATTASQAGHVELHSQSTTVLAGGITTTTAEQGVGGSIKILGERVGIVEGSEVHADGTTGGGQVLVGGDTRGENNFIPNASQVVVSQTVSISASATEDGHGGKAVLWGDDALRVTGQLSARGAGVGDGGFIETSSAVVQLDPTIDVTSETGESGVWLIDPYNITIQSDDPESTEAALSESSGLGFDSIFSPNEGDPNVTASVLTTDALSSSLSGGNAILVETTGSGGQDGDITLEDTLSFDGGNGGSLTLRAHDDITINGAIEDGSTFFGVDSINLTLIANYSTEGDSNDGDITIANGVTIATNGGDFTASGSNFNSTGATISVNAISGVPSGSGNIDIDVTGDATLGAVSLGDHRDSLEPILPSGYTTSTFDVNATNITANGSITSGINDSQPNHTSNVTFTASQDITFTDVMLDNGTTGNDTLTMTLNAGASDGVITINAGSRLWLGGGRFEATGHDFILGDVASVSGGLIDTEGTAVDLFVSGDIQIGGTIETGGGNFTVGDTTNGIYASSFDNYLGGNGGAVVTTGGAIDITTIVDATANGDVTLGVLDNGADADVMSGDITVTSGNNITLQSDYDFHDTATGAIDGNNANPTFTTLTFNADNAITINGEILDSVADTAGDPGSDLGNQDTLNIVFSANRQSGNTAGDVTIENDIYTAGGTITISGANFDSSDHLLNTGYASGYPSSAQWGWTTTGGHISLDMLRSVNLGAVITEGGYARGQLNVSATSITDTDTQALVVAGTSTFTAEGGALSVVLDNAENIFVGDIALRSDQADLVLGNVAINTNRDDAFDPSGTPVTIIATGNIDQPIATDAITLNGSSLEISAADIHTQHIDTSGAQNQGGGAVTITANTGNIVTGDITTDSGETTDSTNYIDANSYGFYDAGTRGFAAGDITLTANASGSEVVAGAISAVGGDGNDSIDGACSSNNNSGGDGEGCFTGSPGGLGGAVDINARQLARFDSITTNGGNASTTATGVNDIAPGGDAGLITVDANTIYVGGDVHARGGILADNNTSDSNLSGYNGESADIIFTGDVVLSGDSTVNTTLLAVPPYEAVVIGDVIFNGNVTEDAANAGQENLTITAGDVDIVGSIGTATNPIGALDITALTGDVAIADSGSSFDIFATSVNLAGNNINAGAISTAGNDGVVGGNIILAASTAVTAGDLDSSGGASLSGNGFAGGDIDVDAAQIILGGVNASGSDAVSGTGGDGGGVDIRAEQDGAAPSIQINGDINANAGAGDTTGSVTQSRLTLAGSGTTSGSVHLNTDTFLSSNVLITGTAQANDTLTGPSDTSFWVSAGNGDGDILNAASGSETVTISFTGFETLQGGSGADDFTLNHNFTSVSGGEGVDHFRVESDINTRLFGEGGADQFYLNADVTDGSTATRDVDGGAGDDTFYVAGDIAVTIEGGDGDNDTVTLVDTTGTHNWVLNGTYRGTLNGSIDFQTVEALNGADGDVDGGDDLFQFNFPGVFGGVNGIDARGGDDDSVLVTVAGTYPVALGGGLRGIANVEGIASNGANDGEFFVLQLADDVDALGTTTTWTIDGVNDGTIDNGVDAPVNFENFGTIRGNQGNDVFTVAAGGSILAVHGVRDGASLHTDESNALSFAVGTHAWSIDGQHSGNVSGSHVTGFSHIQSISGTGADTLTGRDQNNTWTIGAANTLAQTVVSGSATDTLTFSGIRTLNGNDGSDTFVVNEIVDWFFSGGAGDDVFQIGASGGVVGAGAGINGGTSDAVGDRVIARDAENIWHIRADDASNTNTIADNTNAVYVDDFKDIEILEGSDSDADLFDFTILLGLQIEAGTSVDDIADYADVSGNVDITVGTAGVTGVDHFVGNNDGLTATSNNTTLQFDSLAGETVQWRMFDVPSIADADGINDGDINGSITFENVNNLIGGSGNDIFTFDQTANAITGLTGTIHGGDDAGSFGDRIVAPNTAINWVVAPLSGSERLTYNNGLFDNEVPPAPLQTTTSFSDIETLDSGTGNDIFLVGQRTTITLNAGDGSDTIGLPDENISITLGNPIGGLTLNGFELINGTQTRNNALTVTSGAGVAVDWQISSANSGTVSVGGAAPTEFNYFQVLNGGDGDDTFDFSGGGSVVRPGSANGEVNGNGGDNTIIGQAVATAWRIDGNAAGSLTNTATATPYVERFTGIHALQGQSTTDVFTVTANGSFTGTIDGVSGADTLTVASVSGERNEWRLLDETAPIADRVRRLNASNTASSDIQFSNITALVGGTGVDEFVFLSNGLFGGSIDALDASGVSDVVDRSNVAGDIDVVLGTTSINGVENAERVIGNGDTSTLRGLNRDTNAWRISRNDFSNQPIPGADGQNDGTLENGSNQIEFIDFANLEGGDMAVDTFVIDATGNVTGTIYGGDSVFGVYEDQIATLADGAQWALTGPYSGAVNGNTFVGIERGIADGDNDTLRGMNQDNTWTVDGVNTGQVADVNDNAPFYFEGMENISGHQGSDTFVLVDNASGDDGVITGTIIGTDTNFSDASGTDQLTVQSGSGAQVLWTLSQNSDDENTASVAGRVGGSVLLEELSGGNGNDRFDIADAGVTAHVQGNGSSNDVIRLVYTNEAQWSIGDNAVLDSVSVSGAGVVTFEEVETAQGSQGVDRVAIEGAGSGIDVFDSRGGNDVITVVTTDAVTLTIDGGDDVDTLVGANRTNDWVIDAASAADANTLNWQASGEAIAFSAVENFTGGIGTDTFEVRSPDIVNEIRGAIEGAIDPGSDRLFVNLVSGIAQWNITGNNAGNVQADYVQAFFDIENLLGSELQDTFTFTSTDGRISGLIDGGDSADSSSVDPYTDTLYVDVFTDGVVVELGPIAAPGSVVDGTASLPNVNTHNMERIIAADGDPESLENNNWLAIGPPADPNAVPVLDWNWELNADVNEGLIQEIDNLEDLNPIANTQIRVSNFGSMQGGAGDENSNVIARNGSTDPNNYFNLTGFYLEGTGNRSLPYGDIDGLVVVDVDPRIIRLTGNANGEEGNATILRVASYDEANDEFDYNGENIWTIDAVNSGAYENVDNDFSFEFTGVNQLQGGSGDDTFTFARNIDNGTSGVLVDGAINGGSGHNEIRVTTATGDLDFGVNTLQGTPVDPGDIAVSFPDITDPVFLVTNRDGVTDLVNIAQLHVTANNVTTLRSADAGAFEWVIGSFGSNSILMNTNTSESLTFSGVDRVVGGGSADTFTVEQWGIVDPVFDGGEGNDRVDLTLVSTDPLTVSLRTPPATSFDAVYLADVETLDALNRDHAIVADDVSNLWTIDGANRGRVQYDNGSGDQSLAFNGFAHVVGGDRDDVIQISQGGALTGSIDGGGQVADPDRVDVLSDATGAFIFQISARDSDGRVIDTSTDAIDLVGIEQLDANNTSDTILHTLVAADGQTNSFNVGVTSFLFDGVNTLAFSGMDNLTGGDRGDQFIFDGAMVNGLVDGGDNLFGEDSVQILAMSSAVDVRLGDRVSTELNVHNVETIEASVPNAHRLIGEDNTNVWDIAGENAGDVDGVQFTGFGRLVGGSGSDTFVLDHDSDTGMDDRVVSIDGGANPTTGTPTDRIDVTGLANSTTVSFDAGYTADVVVSRVEVIDAADNNNTLVGGNTSTQNWRITSSDEGTLGSAAFSGFANLVGRDQVDQFVFTQNGDISGVVDGGDQPTDQRDVVDLREVADVDVSIGDLLSGYANIETFIGNNSNSTLSAANVRNEWLITDVNGGTLQDIDGNTIGFTGFTDLIGGSDVDVFTVNGGSISGEIAAGGNDDRLTIELADGRSGDVTFIGGEGEDTITINGGDVATRFTAEYRASNAAGEPLASHRYEISVDSGAHSFELDYSEVETVNDDVYVDVLTIDDVAVRDDVITVANNRFDINGFTPVNVTNKDGISIVAQAQDQVVIDGRVSLNDALTVINASVVGADETAVINANRQIAFITTGDIGAQDNRLAIETNNLVLNAVNGDVYLDQDGDLTIAQMTNPQGVVDINAQGTLRDGSVLSSNNVVRLASDESIELDNANALAGALYLNAVDGAVTLTNGTTNLAQVTAQDFTLTTDGNVTDSGDIQVANSTTINAADTSIVILDSDNNTFNAVTVSNTGTLEIRDTSDNGMNVQALVTGDAVVSATNELVANGVTAEDVVLTSDTAEVTVQNAIQADNSVSIAGEGVTVIGSVNVATSTAENAITIDANNGALDIQAAITADADTGDIVLSGQSLTQAAGAAISGRNVTVQTVGDVALTADVTAADTVDVVSGGVIDMNSGVTPSVMDAQTITLTATGSITTQQLIAENISISSELGDITQEQDVNANTLMITASNGAYDSAIGSVATVNGGDFVVSTQSASLEGDVQSDGNVTFTMDESLLLGGVLQGGNVDVTTGDEVTMAPTSQLGSDTSIVMNAGGDIALSQLTAVETVTLNAGGSVSDNGADGANITADRLFARSESGFSAETSVANLDVQNASGSVGVSNDQDVTITSLISNGNIRLVNTNGNVILDNMTDDYDRAETDARLAGGVVNANYTEGNLSIFIPQGYLNARPGAVRTRPELVGDVIDVTTRDGFGFDRQLVVYANTELIVSGPGIYPIWAFGDRPAFGLTTDSDLIDPSVIGSVSDLVLDVEPLENVDPAVFTDLNMYEYNPDSVCMPEDQRYEEHECTEIPDSAYY